MSFEYLYLLISSYFKFKYFERFLHFIFVFGFYSLHFSLRLVYFQYW